MLRLVHSSAKMPNVLVKDAVGMAAKASRFEKNFGLFCRTHCEQATSLFIGLVNPTYYRLLDVKMNYEYM